MPFLVALVVSVLGLASTVGRVGVAEADPVTTIFHLAPQDGTGPGAGAAPATQPAAAPSPTVEPLLGDVAGPAREVSLPDVLAMAVRTSPALAQARIDREIAEIAVQRAETWRDWQVGADLDISSRRSTGSDAQTTSVSLSGDALKPLITGGTVGVHAEAGWDRGPNGFDPGTGARTVESEYTESVTATLTQPLLRGRGESLRTAAERQARLDLDASALAQRAEAISAVREVVLAYLDLVDAEDNLAIQRSSLDLARERLRVTEAGIKAGGTAESETISVEQAIATREAAVMNSELAVINASLALRRLVGMEMGPGEIDLASKIDLAVPSRTWDLAALIAQAEANSPELAQLSSQEAGATIEVEVTENGFLPSLDASLTAGPTGVGSNPGAAAKNMVTFDAYTVVGSLSYQSTLGERAAHADALTARARREKIRVSADDVRRQIIQSMASSVAQVQAAERQFGISARAVKLAEKNLAVEQARLALGRSRNVDVLMRQDELRAAQLQAAQEILSWHRSSTAIAALTGELLPTYGISVGDK